MPAVDDMTLTLGGEQGARSHGGTVIAEPTALRWWLITPHDGSPTRLVPSLVTEFARISDRKWHALQTERRA